MTAVKKATKRLLRPLWVRAWRHLDSRFQRTDALIADQFRSLANRQDSYVTWESTERLRASGPRAEPAIAVIAPMPPAKTGIASCTLLSFLAANYGVDIYAPHESIDEYLNAVHDARLTASNVRIFSVNTLAVGRTLCKYKAQLFVLGNSKHNLDVGCALRNLAEFPVDLPTFVHIHDPCLLNLLAMLCEKFETSFERLLRNSYAAKLSAGSKLDFRNHRALAEQHIYGLRALLSDLNISGIFVNSSAAVDIVREDLSNFDRSRIHKLFHPVFETSPVRCRPAERNRLIIGTYGWVSAESKNMDLIVAAFRKVRTVRPDVDLLIAGWGAQFYFAQAPNSLGDSGIIVEDSPSSSCFETLMQSCDLAVQLRKVHHEETSGVVSQLLALGKPTIVSAVGAFLEFGDAVTYAPFDVTPAQLADLILAELENKIDRRLAIDDYVSVHSPALFCSRLSAIMDETSDASKSRPESALFAREIGDTRSDLKDVRERYIARVVRGKSFIDVGGLFEIIKEQVSRAQAEGATKLALADIEPFSCPWWEAMRKHLASKGIHDCKFISGDIQNTDVGQFDVVYSSGVFYHTSNPLGYLAALKRIAKEFVILATTVLPDHVPGSVDLDFNPATVLYVPATPMQQRQQINKYYARDGRWDFFADAPTSPSSWYGNWFVPTLQSLIAMCVTVGFDVVDCQTVETDLYRSYALLLRPRG
jgi:glycosyltransferase involved in cell wall biosynthesis